MSPLVIVAGVSLVTAALSTLISFRFAVLWQQKQWALMKYRTHHFDDYWESKNMVRRWNRTYRWSFSILIALLLFSVGLGVFSVAF